MVRTAIFKKVLTATNESRRYITAGEITMLVAMAIDKFSVGFVEGSRLVTVPLNTAICLGMLYLQVRTNIHVL